MARSDSGVSQGPLIWGLIVIAALAYLDFKMPLTTEWTDFSRMYYSCAKSGALAPVVPQERTKEAAVLTTFTPTNEQFCEPPLVLRFVQPLTALPTNIALAVWQAVSLIALGLSAYFVAAGAAKFKDESETTSTAGWACLTFAPVLLTLCLGQLSLVLGLLPLTLGYFLICSKKPALAGLVMSVTVLQPAFLIVAMVNAIAQSFKKKYQCAVALLIGVALFAVGFLTDSSFDHAMLMQWITNFGEQTNLDPRLNVSFQHAALMFTPNNREAMAPLIMLVAVIIAIGGLAQLRAFATAENKKFEIAPFATMLGCLMVPIVAPNLSLQNLTVLVAGGLVAYCYEWREHLEFRVHTVTRMVWLFTTLYMGLFYFNPAIAHPGGLALLYLALFLRMAETVRFAASTQDF